MRQLIKYTIFALACLSTSTRASVFQSESTARAGRTLFYQYEVENSMSYPHPKGKSVKGPKSVKSIKSKKSKLPPPPHPSKAPHPSKSKGKGSITKAPLPPKKSKGSGKGKGITTPAPHVPGTPTLQPATVPTFDTGSPVAPGTPTSSPAGDSVVVDISPWEITYTVDTGSIPLDDDYAALTEATSDYLDGYFASYFEIIGNIDFISSTTVKISDQFVLNQPIIVGFSAIALFSETSQTIPSTTDMNSLLAQAFAGDGYTAYLSVVQSLSNTLFSTTSEFSFTQAAQSSEQESTTAKTAGIAAAAAAGAFAIVMGVLMFHRRRATQDEDDFYNPQKVHDGDGHMTVAGETIGETIAGTMSLESRSLYNTEDGVPEGADSWEGYQQHYSTAAYRTDSPIDDELGHDSDESERSDDSDASPRYMENVAL